MNDFFFSIEIDFDMYILIRKNNFSHQRRDILSDVGNDFEIKENLKVINMVKCILRCKKR